MPGSGYGGQAGIFLIETLFGLYILIVMLRFLLQWLRADFYNPVSQFIVKATQPPLRPLRRMIPGFKKIDVASVVLMFGLKYVELWITVSIMGIAAGPTGLGILAIADLIKLLINVFSFAILIQIVISWVNPGAHNPITTLMDSLTRPLLEPARRWLPPMSGFDLSPIPVLIALQLAKIVVVLPIRDLGRGML